MTRKIDRVVRAALARGDLKLEPQNNCNAPMWRFGRRRFNLVTVQRAISNGYAVRDGDVVRMA